MGAARRLLILAALLIGSTLSHGVANACFMQTVHYDLSRIDHVEVILKGRLIKGIVFKNFGTLIVHETYKGPKRKTWSIAAPPVAPRGVVTGLGWKYALAPGVGYNAARSSESDVIVGLVKPQFSHATWGYWLGMVDHQIAGGGCGGAFLFPYSKTIDTRLKVAFSMIGNAGDAQREQLLRQFLRFRVTSDGPVVREKLLNSLTSRRRQGFDQEDVEDLTKAYTARWHKYLTPFRVSPFPSMDADIIVNKIRNYRADLENLITNFDIDGDESVSKAEFNAAAEHAYRFYK